MTFTQPISIYGIPVDEAALSLAEKSAIVVERGDAGVEEIRAEVR